MSYRENSTTEAMLQMWKKNETEFYFERPRLNNLFLKAVNYPLVIVCAGAGYGKTSAVHDFAVKYGVTTVWGQVSELDNMEARYWENYIHSVVQLNQSYAKELGRLGFPDTKEKINSFLALQHKYVDKKPRIVVMDDFHSIKNPSIIRFVEECIFNKQPPGTSILILSRSPPQINTAGMIYRNQIFNISENDLRFTDDELAQYFRSRDISIKPEDLREIMRDTGGWAFAINLITRSYQKAPGYAGYIRDAMKTNIFKLIETEIWDTISESLQFFLVRLSLISHLSFDLIGLLAGGDESLFAEFERLNAYIRIDSYINAYLIHPLFLEFLCKKQEILSEDQKRETYAIAAAWCNSNGFRIDALSYFEKIGDYQSIVHLFFELPTQLPAETARYVASIFDRAPPEDFDKVKSLAETHLRTYIQLNLFEKALELVKRYEAKFQALPEDDIDGKRILARLYLCWAYIRISVGSTEDVYDFDTYMEKACKLLSTSIDPGALIYHCPGAWTNCVGTSRKGAPEDFIAAAERAQVHILPSFIRGFMAGEAELARGELEFYRGEVDAAALNVNLALKKAREYKQLGIIHRALHCSLRIAASQGNSTLAEQMLKETKDQLNETDYLNRFLDYDISLSWYYCFLGLPKKTVDWAKDDFSPFSHPGFVENFMNQIKVKYCYATRKFHPLLVFIDEMRRRNSYLFERIELLAMEACIYYKMNNKKKAFSIFVEAYETALPNGILMPFIELGKDMRTLTASALKESDCKIPGEWLELVYRKATSYSKRQAHISTEYKKANDEEDFVLSPREMQILSDLSHGLTRAEIAVNRDLSLNTVKTIINMIYSKAGATNLPNLIRIALERKMI